MSGHKKDDHFQIAKKNGVGRSGRENVRHALFQNDDDDNDDDDGGDVEVDYSKSVPRRKGLFADDATGKNKKQKNDNNTNTPLNNQQIAFYTSQIKSLNKQLSNSKEECDIAMKKFDRRFQNEIIARRQWNTEKFELIHSVEELKSSKLTAEAKVTSLERQLNKMMQMMKPMFSLYQSMQGIHGENVLNDCSGIPLSPTATANVGGVTNDAVILAGTPNDGKNIYMQKPFCIICQLYHANIMLVPCGHICLCQEQAFHMQNNSQLGACPICKSNVRTSCKVNGFG